VPTDPLQRLPNSAAATWRPEALRGAPRIGLGLAALGRPAYITTGRDVDLGLDRSVEARRRRTETVLDAAYQAGIRYVDAARSYGLAEDFLAGWLAQRGVSPQDIAVGSKWGYTYVGEWRLVADRHEVQDLSAAAFERQLAQTRAALGAHLDLYQVHSATRQNGVLASPEVLAALRRVREDGLAVGVTVTGPDQVGTIDSAVDLGLFDTVQATWNVLEPSSGAALARAHAAGLTVIVKEAVANGRLTNAGDQPELVSAATERGMTADALAISAALAQPWAGIVLSGAVSAEMLHQNRAATETAWDDELAELGGRLAESPDAYWAERSRRSWT
jgi:aryl-alcohol dehydrogenase-like predicted oxidoreductase